MSILDSLKLRFASPERLQELAHREAALQERVQALAARAQNVSYREDKAKTDPESVYGAIQADRERNAKEAEHAKAADKIKRAYGLQSGDLIDTPEMRAALERELGRLEVEQDERAQRIADRASLLAGLEQLAAIDASRARSILHEYKEAAAQTSYSREEIGSMLGAATGRHGSREYARDLDGWARSIADRERDLRREEALLSHREDALIAKLERELHIEPKYEKKLVEMLDRAHGLYDVAAGAAGNVATTNVPLAGELGQQVQEEKTAEVTQTGPTGTTSAVPGDGKGGIAQHDAAATSVGAEPPRAVAEYTLKELEDPARLKVVAGEIARNTGKSLSDVEGGLRDMIASVSKDVSPEKARLDEGRRMFWAAGAQSAPDANAHAKSRTASGLVTDVGENPTKGPAAAGKATLDVLPRLDPTALAAIADAQAAARSIPSTEVAAEDGGKAKRSRGVSGFKSLGRNKSVSAVEVQTPTELGEPTAGEANAKPVAGKKMATAETAADSHGARRGDANTAEQKANSDATTRSQAKFRDLSPDQKAERRAEYMSGLRRDAGLTSDGKDVAKEKGKEVGKRKGKQVDGVGL
ncbi:hypothetical protein L0Z31_09495 [Burkholderia vietnamiensis]|uniref:hypothetical protein n=1 Tax=Burkholderia vietnamiensis TaxID=60552 RepID=UPI000B21A6B4|nr:hypothetical protein [Burkholderia vietnamiensis]MCO1351612.1 hypothetical protein [Burkholderia vietnamiensis]MCO1430196.1 hypothetical protein [Burkholderia vietnamiensis]UQN50970.1 hypothetical protein L0Y95_29120 [Burkholderia vietnamiensis]HDR9036914.1 hypothetical protein [Burkholderia vietnamiensis]HDR9070082.1 hypothetical protein [Burkholderia vietnamiensis]